jgi:tetratricopeptide (TPR) repeat protein
MYGEDGEDHMTGEEGKVAQEILRAIGEMEDEEFQSLCRELADHMDVQIEEIESSRGEMRIRGAVKRPGKDTVPLTLAFKRGTVEPEDLQRMVSLDKEAAGVFITASDFSDSARTYGEEFEVKMFDADGLISLLRQYDLADSIEDRLRRKFVEREGVRFLPSIDRLEEFMKLANDHYSISSYKKALRHVDQALELKPNYDHAWSLKSRIHEALGDMDKALECAKKAAEYNIGDPELWLALGSVLSKMGRTKEEIECYERAISLDKKFTQAWINKGVALHSLGRYKDALQCYDHVLELDASHAQALNNRGAALRKLGQEKEALKMYEKAIELKPDYIDAWVNKAVLLQLVGDDAEAIKAFDRVLQEVTDDPKIWYQKGISHMNLKEDADAKKCFDEALGLDPSLIEARNAKEKMAAGVRKKGYPCFGGFDSKDEGCVECEVSKECKEKSK